MPNPTEHSDKRTGQMPPKGFKCKKCGHCCLNLLDAFQTSATDQDIQMWESNGRDDILEWVDPIHVGGVQYVYDIWISPNEGFIK